MIGNFAPAALALIFERVAGYPDWLNRAVGHPVSWMGALLAALEERANDPSLLPARARLNGALTLFLLLLTVGAAAALIALLCNAIPNGWIAEAIVASTLLAQKSLRDHVLDVAAALGRSLPQARNSVSHIVGRDPEALDESGVACAALESLAENASDGVVAPLLCYILFGLPGIAIYKAINTADSMIGHKNARYLHFGWAAAKLDDLVNLPASRLTALLFAAAAAWERFDDGIAALRATARDAAKHRSPNAGWPEAALAGALGIALGGPRTYHGEMVALPAMGDGRTELHRDDIHRGLRLYATMLSIIFALTLLGAALISA